MEYRENNIATLAGTIISEPRLYEIQRERFCEMIVETARRSGITDKLCVNAPVWVMQRVANGDKVCFEGEIRTYDRNDADGTHHVQTVFFAREIYDYERDLNRVSAIGVICKEPVFRLTPLSREVCDIMLGVNRNYGRSSYLHCLVWGNNAHCARHLSVGTLVEIEGRFQSRDYVKKNSDGTIENKTAYEISVGRIVVVEDGEE